MSDDNMVGKSFEKRKKIAEAVLKQKKGKFVPVYIKKSENARIQEIAKTKYLVPSEMTVGEFMCALRNSINLHPEECIFLFADNCIPSSSAPMGELYEQYHKEDKILYLTYMDENVYGGIS